MSSRWSRETKLGEGVRYITRNFAKLTAYLDDPRLELTNNFFSERMGRGHHRATGFPSLSLVLWYPVGELVPMVSNESSA